MEGINLCTGFFTLLALVIINYAQLPPLNGNLPDTPKVVINEIYVSEDDGQYIELYDGGRGSMSMNRLALVLFEGINGISYAESIALDGMTTNEEGYFLLSTSSFPGTYNKTIVNIRNNGLNAIALYETARNQNQIGLGSRVTNQGLLDAVVYSSNSVDPGNNSLIVSLLPGKAPLQISSLDASLSRCRGWHGLMPRAFWSTGKTPMSDNDCELPNILINEVNVLHAQTFNDVFVEVYDGGIGYQSLDGIILAFYHSELDLHFLALDLTNHKTNADGIFVVGVQPSDIYNLTIFSFQLPETAQIPSPDGIALHLASPARFERLVPYTNYQLIDAVVYTGPNSDVIDLTLQHVLLPYQHLVSEVTGPNMLDRSISRCLCCKRLDTASFGEGPLTPGALNVNCTLGNRTLSESGDIYQKLVRINEVKLMDPDRPDNVGEFIELSVNGFGTVKLDGMVLVLYRSSASSYRTISLDGYVTSNSGYLLIGKSGMRPVPDIEIEDDQLFLSGAGAVALYSGSADDFPDSTSPVGKEGLMDAVVFGFPGDLALRLRIYLTSGQGLVELEPPIEGQTLPSILRCFSHSPTTQLAYVVGTPSPGLSNACPLPPVVINELNVVATGDGIGEFLEISSLGIANFPLDTLVVIFWTTKWAKGGINLDGWKTDMNGLFLIEDSTLQTIRPTFPVSLSQIVNENPGAISIHVGTLGMYPPRSSLHNENLVDALVFGINKDDNIPQQMMDILTPGRPWFHEDELAQYEDVSINRCVRGNEIIEYILDDQSPNGVNYCPRLIDAKIVINEVHLTSNFQMFIELWDMGVGFTELTGLQLAFFGTDGTFIMAKNLTGQTDHRGYYIIGHQILRFAIPDLMLSIRFQLPGGGAVALYETAQSFAVGDSPTSEAILSAMVHVMGMPLQEASENFNIVTPGSSPFVQTNISALNSPGIALSRCFNLSARVSAEAFILEARTPRDVNDCPVLPNDVYINEVEVTKLQGFFPSVKDEFIELYDGGRGNTIMKYLTLVLFDGGIPFSGGFSSDLSFFSINLDGYRTNSDGYFVVGSSLLDEDVVDYSIDTSHIPFLQVGIVGIALYHAPVGAFPDGSNATNNSLVDALIYVTGRQSVDHSLVDTLLPDVTGLGMVRESGSRLEPHGSISRCLGEMRKDPQAYILTEVPTPGKENNCSAITPNFDTALVINEVNLDPDGFFVELFDFGVGNTNLDTLILVFYGTPVIPGTPAVSRLAVDLHGYSTNDAGYFVVGTDPSSDKVVENNRGVATGVGLYHAKLVQFPTGTLPTMQNLIDVVIVNNSIDNAFVTALIPGQMGVSDMDNDNLDRSVSRCFAKLPLDMFAFWPSTPTPGSNNNCTRTTVVINEINVHHESTFIENEEFIELYDGGVGYTPLTGTVVVIYNSAWDNTVFNVIPLNSQTNENGYFVIGRPNQVFTVDLQIQGLRQLVPNEGGIALYHDDAHNFEQGMAATNQNLQDAIVYSVINITNPVLIDYLLPGQSLVVEDRFLSNGDESLVRCVCCEPLQTSVYKQSTQTPGRENICVIPTTGMPMSTTSRPVLTVPSSAQVKINEIGIKTARFHSEYIELKGVANLAMENYYIVLYDIDGVSYFSLQLQQATGPNGLYLIGSANVSPQPVVILPRSIPGIIKEEAGAVVLYYGYASDIPVGTEATDKNLIDAVVYTANADSPVRGNIDVLTPQTEQFFADLTREESISRCFWDSVRNNADFTETLRTPGSPNDCPSEEFKRTLQMKLVDADFSVWQSNPQLLTSLRQKIIDGINEQCECGFNYHYIADEVILKGSVVWQADILAFNTNQSSQIYSGFSSYVSDIGTLEIEGTTYRVDKCIEDCVSQPTPPVPTKKAMTTAKKGVKREVKGNNSSTAVGVTIGVILLLVLVAVVVFVLIRKHVICYSKDTHLTEDEEDSQKMQDLSQRMLEFPNNTYDPSC